MTLLGIVLRLQRVVAQSGRSMIQMHRVSRCGCEIIPVGF